MKKKQGKNGKTVSESNGNIGRSKTILQGSD